MFLVVIAILFLLSSGVDNAYNAIVKPLPIPEQIEFSRIIRLTQVSRGLSTLGYGIFYLAISVELSRPSKLSEKSKSKMLSSLYL